MIDFSLIQTAVNVIEAILILWFVSMAIREQRIIAPYIPFIVIGVALCGYATLYHFSLLLSAWRLVFASIFFLGHLGLLGVLVWSVIKHKRV